MSAQKREWTNPVDGIKWTGPCKRYGHEWTNPGAGNKCDCGQTTWPSAGSATDTPRKGDNA
jgi:hypothetical protein